MDDDTHYCLNCRVTIHGLENYVAHRKDHCLGITGASTPAAAATSVPPVIEAGSRSPTQLSVTVTTPPTVPSAPDSTSMVQEAGMILYDPQPVATETALETYSAKDDVGDGEGEKEDGEGGGGIADFLSSLELQVRENKEKRIVEEDKLKTLNILTDLGFSSDSDGLPSDVDDLLDYANDAEEDSAYRRVPRGGKWGPSGKLAASGKGKGKLSHTAGKTSKHAPRTYGGKGSKLRSHSKHSVGKSADSKEKNKPAESDDEEEEVEPRAVANKHECKTCCRTFAGQHSYDRHLKSRFHKHKLHPRPEKKVIVKEEIECPICEKVFNTKYNFARHLASTYHTRREAGNKPMVLDEQIQRLLLKQSPVQCHVCSFYCNSMKVMFEHMNAESHVEKCSTLSGPLICVPCKFKVYSNDALLQHMNTPEHIEKITSSNRACIVKEVRVDVQCLVCHKDFHSASRLEQHMKEYHKLDKSDDPLKRPPKQKGVRYKMTCPFCSKECNTSFELNIHIRRKHTQERPYPCKTCGVAFTDEASLKAHEATKKHMNQQVLVGLMTSEEALISPDKIKTERQSASSQPRNVCQKCDFTSHVYSEMKNHYQAEHPENLFFCKPCSFTSFLEKQFERHCRTPTHAKRQAACKDKDADDEGEFICETCFAVFASKEVYEVHKLNHVAILSEKQLRSAHDGDPLVGVHPRFKEFWYSSCQNQPKSQKIQCVECKQSICAQNMIGHLRKHSDSCPFHCPKCPLKFASASSLRRHMQVVHLNIKVHQCHLCTEKFSRRTYLLSHLLRIHKDAAEVDCPHVCTDCDKAFPLKHMLTSHMASHSTERPFACEFEGCDAMYKARYELELHRRKHTGERPYVCEFCGYSSTGRQKLTRHLKTHTQERNYSCQYCEYKAMNSTHLHRHMRIHIGSKPYKCPYCSHTCNTHENIRKHILRTKRHRGLPCYPCKLCDFGTNFVKDYAQHLDDAHNQKVNPKEILSVIAGVFNKSEDTKDIPEGSCALPVKEKTTNKVKTATINRELKRKREKSPKPIVIKVQKQQFRKNFKVIRLAQPQMAAYPGAQDDVQTDTTTQRTQEEGQVIPQATEAVTFIDQQPGIIPVSISEAIKIVPYQAHAGNDQSEMFEAGHQEQQYEMVYTTEAAEQPGTMDVIPAESSALAQERVETVDSIKRAMDELDERNLEAIEVDQSALLHLDNGTVQWVNDGSVIVCNNSELYDKLQMVVYDEKAPEGSDPHGAVREVVVGEGEMFDQDVGQVTMESICKEETME